ncbi:MAG: SUMF1/EgtB/PvdO family nonheme iron enzyme [Anaerolineales bacterium]|nr:SUMF1/EgtB/PvdO family nonheme iron enzyme [Anaerolineales bacterium]
MPLTTGQVIHQRYRIEKLLGLGGFGAVYKAWDMHLKIPCAVKENLEASPEAARQFEREATMLAGLRHPNLPKVSDHFILPGRGQYLAMEYIEGQDLQEILEQAGGALPERQVLDWAGQILEALAYLHQQKPPVIHRDIKPANIHITPQGQAILVDFGLAKFFDPGSKTTRGARAVTPGYSPVEQYGKGSTDERSDVYSLGATLYTLLTGQEPVESVQRVVRDPLLPARQLNPGLSQNVADLLEKALQIDPEKRFQSAGDMHHVQQACLANPPAALPGPVTPAAQKAAHSPRRLGWMIGAAILVALIAVTAFLAAPRGDTVSPAVSLTASPAVLTGAPAASLTSPTAAITPQTPTPSPTSAPEPTPVVYTVQKEDTCSGIARIFGTSVQKIASLNNLAADCGVILVGQKLLIQAWKLPAEATLLPDLAATDPLSITQRVSPLDGMPGVYVPAGVFRMGSSDVDAESDEKPERWVYLDAFWIDRTEVTNGMYELCVRAGACQAPQDTRSRTRLFYNGDPRYSVYPVIHVSWADASAYCQWAGRRMPSEAEWEKAARGVDARTFPWGERRPSLELANFDNRIGDTTQVGSFPNGASPYGALDMAGNVSEWVSDWYAEKYYTIGPAVNPFGPQTGDFRILRGGSWLNIEKVIRAAYRLWNVPEHGYEISGIRCAQASP